MTDDSALTRSPLCQQITRDGKTVTVDIYRDGDDGWTLEVVDAGNTSTLWDDPFATDQEALDEVLDAIEQEGIDCLILPDTSLF